jgi:ornithine carbamoyltransferase
VSSQPLDGTEVLPQSISGGFLGRDLISIRDFSPQEIKEVLDLATLMKAHPTEFRSALAGKQIVMFFEKPSLRTRITFEAGMASLGGQAIFVDQTSGRMDARESLKDIAHNLERWVNGIVLRTFSHATVEGMALHASIPVINALSEREHPCQALADFLTLQERFGDLRKITLAYVGDGNNVTHSLLLTCAALGSKMRVATPAGFGPDEKIVQAAQELARKTGAVIELLTDPRAAVNGADAVYTDAWASMGQEHEASERERIFPSYQVNDQLMALAASNAAFMHCLPAHRGQEATDAVMDSARSVIFDQAENRLHVQKAILMLLLGGKPGRIPVRSSHV